MKMNRLINKVSDIFYDEDRVIIHTYDDKIKLYAYVFTNIELRRLWRLAQGETIAVDISSTASIKVCITLLIKEAVE